ncbi:MAG: fatty-acid oxidation protein subunit alpha [Saprospiraceae bacterium]|nr:fatty-acid oxidation protein subunit alpha [Saprospiraceae bacterium]
MPKRDNLHQVVKIALYKEGWNITYDPLFVPTEGGINFFIDLGMERFIGAEKEGEKIAVEIKSFDAITPFYSFYELLGQYLMYEMAIEEQDTNWSLFVAITQSGFEKLEEAPIFKRAIAKFMLKFIIF